MVFKGICVFKYRKNEIHRLLVKCMKMIMGVKIKGKEILQMIKTADIIKNVKQIEKENLVAFWKVSGEYGYLSNWYYSEFKIEDVVYDSAEKYIMAQKAIVFQDMEMLEKILASTSQRDIKAYGRKVKNYDDIVWAKKRYDIGLDALKAKFSQNEELKNKLLGTGDKIIVEASPLDRIWGIGLSEQNKDILTPKKWRGRNLLGDMLMQAREELEAC